MGQLPTSTHPYKPRGDPPFWTSRAGQSLRHACLGGWPALFSSPG
nr:MAG TPA: hypothetical protein [Caudoviricetes sp.]